MQSTKVALIGAPMVGKTELLYSLSKLIPSSKPNSEVTEAARLIHLHIVAEHQIFHLITIQGPFLDQEAVVGKVLSGVDVVIYVIAASPKTGQERIFEDFVAYARRLRVTWNEVSWIFVLNKTDIATQNPMTSKIPAKLQEDLVYCSAVTGDGVQKLWGKLQLLAR